MTIPRTVAEILHHHVQLEVEGIDRMYLNLYVPTLQRVLGVVGFFRHHRGELYAASPLMDRMTKPFVAAIERFAKDQGVELVAFEKGQRKDDQMQARLKKFTAEQGLVFIGKAQEKAKVLRTQKRKNPETGQPYPWLVPSTAMVNHFYFYCVDCDFGPFFVKFCTYFPYNAKLCINGHEYLKRQLAREGIPFKPLDNGVLSCADPGRLQEICDSLDAAKIDALLRKWLARLPHPFSPADRAAGYRYDISILQVELSLTQVLDRPVTGRIFFEQVIRENLDIGRPDQAQLIFERRVTRRTPGRFRTRVITEGVIASLHIDYKHTRIKQYHKEGRALRTETTINNTRDFGIGKRLSNLPALREIGFRANRRLLDVQRISHDCAIGEDAFNALQLPRRCGQQRVASLRFGDPRVLVLLAALVVMRLLPNGFRNRELRDNAAALLGQGPEPLSPGRMTYDLRRLRNRGLIERIDKSHRYRVTDFGLRTALFYSRAYARIVRPGLSLVCPTPDELPPSPAPLDSAFRNLERAMDRWCSELAA